MTDNRRMMKVSPNEWDIVNQIRVEADADYHMQEAQRAFNVAREKYIDAQKAMEGARSKLLQAQLQKETQRETLVGMI